MIGEVKQILSKPEKHTKDGELVHDAYVSINLNVYKNSHSQVKAIMKLIEEHSDGDYIIEIKPLHLQGKILDENTARNEVEDNTDAGAEEADNEEVAPQKPYIPRTLTPQHETLSNAKE